MTRALFFLLTAALGTLAAGCAHEEQLQPAREPPSDLAFESAPPPPTEPPPPPRPRLSRTVTLGETQGYAPAPPPAAAAAPSQGNVNVTVNNHITSPPVVYGGYGYGYGGAGFRGGDGRSFSGSSGSSGTRTPWAPSGWEGAQRTAAPGQTPGVGGNWSPPPSYGPAQMK